MRVSLKEDEEGRPEVQVTGAMETEREHNAACPLPDSRAEGLKSLTLSRSEFAAVVFHKIAETYPVDANISCPYTLTSDIEPSNRDWVGIFKVGWLSPRDYLYYEWAPIPPQYERGKEMEAELIFPADRLPKDDGEFYQFCYVSSTGCIRGASTPFQFKRPCADDFVEVDEETDNEMLVIRPKTVFLEEEVEKMRKLQHTMEQEREGLVEKLRKAQSRSDASVAEIAELKSQLSEMTTATKDMSVAHDELKAKVEILEEECQRLQLLLKEAEIKLFENLKKLKVLESDKDELEGRNQGLLDEMTSYKMQVAESQAIAASHLKEIERLTGELENLNKKLQNCVPAEEKEALNNDFLQLLMKIDVKTAKMDELKQKASADKANIESLELRLQQMEDQLQAAHEMKMIMSREMDSYRIAQDKLSHDLENTKGQNHALKEQLQLMEVGFSDELKLIKKENRGKEDELDAIQKKLELVQQENNLLNQQLKEATEGSMVSQEAAASLYALQMANDALKSRHDKMAIALEEKEKELITLQRQSRHLERELKREAEDLRERVQMCTDEYRTLLKENAKLYRKLEKQRSCTTPTNNETIYTQTDKGDITAGAICKETLVEKPLLERENPVCTVSSCGLISSVLDDTTDACSLSQMEKMAKELEQRKHKTDRYKRLYLQEKERGDLLRSHYYEQLQEKDADIERIKKTAANHRSNAEQQIRCLENYIAEKDALISDLNNKLRELKVEEKPRSGTATSPSRDCVDGSSEPQLRYGNPYSNQAPEGAAAENIQPNNTYYCPTFEEEKDEDKAWPHESDEEAAACAGLECSLPQESYEVVNSQGPAETRGQLPPPLQPQVLPSAKLAAVKQQIGSSLNYDIEEPIPDLLFEDCCPEPEDQWNPFTEPELLPNSNTVPSAPTEYADDDRFLDAIGDSMKVCPVCQVAMTTGLDSEYQEHVVAHFGRLCPVCKVQVDDTMKTEDFEDHVNKCLEELNSRKCKK